MSGHNKWSSIKHKKGAADAKRSKTFTKVIREITVAAKSGGEDPNANPRLRAAINLAKTVNMPSDNIQKAIRKGSGGDKAENWESIIYEGYGPHNVAVVVECLTDNRNRTISSVRGIFNKNNGNIGASNSVMYMFDRKGVIEIETRAVDEEQLTEWVIESGAEDIDASSSGLYIIETKPSRFSEVYRFLEEKSVQIKAGAIRMIPQTRLIIDDEGKALQVIRFIEALEDDDDVQNVYSNFDISEDVLERIDR
jgi:YebC/PmpR family DNA-binding regulatory protein